MDTAIRSVMTRYPYAIPADAPLLDARKLMLEHKLRHLPVVRDDDLVGLLSDRDIKLMLGPEFAYPDPRELRGEDVMVPDPYVVELATPLETVLEGMVEHRADAALVVRKGRLAGILTVTDVCRGFSGFIRGLFPDGGDSAA